MFNEDTGNIDEANIVAASANIIGYFTAAPHFDDIPTFMHFANDQMKHVLIFLMPAQKDSIF